MTDFVLRKLTYTDERGAHHEIAQSEIATLAEPIVILGEAGLGKSMLLEWLGERPRMVFTTAKGLLRRSNPAILVHDGKTLVIDALDEVAAAGEGDAVHRVLGQLDKAGHPHFILSCRAAEWQGAVAKQDISADYGKIPVIMTLRPFSREDAVAFLHIRHHHADSEVVIRHLEEKGLAELYGNPLTLGLFGRIAEDDQSLPENRAQLFQAACDLLWQELNERYGRTRLAQMSPDVAFNAAGAVCAVQILTGCDAISTGPAAKTSPNDLHLSEILKLPHAEAADAALKSRLFKSLDESRFAPIHRTVAEYLGARWLAINLSGLRSERRLFELLTLDGGVPSSLRGLHAWMAHQSQAAAHRVIAADPYGVLRYGDQGNRISELCEEGCEIVVAPSGYVEFGA